MEEYKTVYMFGRTWDNDEICKAEREIFIAMNNIDTLRVADIAENALREVKRAYRLANNPKSDKSEDLNWSL